MSTQTSNPKTGLFMIGVFKGFRTHPKPNSTFVNYYCGICVGDSTDSYGASAEVIEELSLKPEQFQQMQHLNNMIGKPVRVAFKVSHRKGTTDRGKAWSFVSMYIPEGCTIEPLTLPSPVQQKAS